MRKEILYDRVFDAQAHYRLLLDAMARPGKVNRLPVLDLAPPAGFHQTSVLVALALLNADTCFASVGHDPLSIDEYLILNTSARPVATAAADFVFVDGRRAMSEDLSNLKTGSLSYPEESATLIVDVDEISSEPVPGALILELSGPGVDGRRKVYMRGLDPAVLQTLEEQNLEFPLGIDAIFTDAEQRFFCIPRTSRMIVTHGVTNQ